jgi:hypothetical protein
MASLRLLWCRAYGDDNAKTPRDHCLATRARGTSRATGRNRILSDRTTHMNGGFRGP